MFPLIKAGKDAEFLDWFVWSNKEHAIYRGFISRTLVKQRDGGSYMGLVEHESYGTFMAMHTSSRQAGASQRAKPLFDGSPASGFLDVVLE